ncbi:MAG: endonuclease III [Bacilli bacterium]|nr:endonuclease III [Bacilli bacterium]
MLNEIFNKLNELFPDAHCELNYHNIYELAVSVILSAQTTDERVNLVTPTLFEKYPTVEALSNALVSDVEEIIHSVGLYQTKAKNIINFSKQVISEFNGIIPNTLEELITLPGIGRKTANVILFVGYGLPGLAVDTHVSRVSKRLGLVEEDDDVLAIELKLKKMFDEKDWGTLHHSLLFFGRYLCKAQKPMCEKCPFINICTKK